MFSATCICDVLCSRHTSRGKDSSLLAGELTICFAKRHSAYALNLKKNKTCSHVGHHFEELTKSHCTVCCAGGEEGKKKNNTHIKVESKFYVINGLLVNGDLNQILL